MQEDYTMDETEIEETEMDDALVRKHAFFLRDFDTIQSAQREERMNALSDRRFYSIAGAQWEGDLGDQFSNKLRFEVNKIHKAVIRIFNEYRNNRIGVRFVPKPGEKSGEYDNLVDTCAGLFRADEADSCAEEAYDNAFEEAVGGGYGAFRLKAEYEDEYDEEDDRQRVRFIPIYDADSCVFFDLDSKRQDKSDAKRCYVLTTMDKNAYVEEHGDVPASWSKDINQVEFDWFTPDLVVLAEAYEIEEKKVKCYVYQDLAGEEVRYTDEDFAEDEGLRARLDAIGTRKIREKVVKQRRCHKYLMDGARIIEDQGYIAGPNIPVVVVYGKRWFVDGVERFMGHVRLSKDIQRLKNLQLSKLGEMAAASSYSKPIVTPEQIAGHQVTWEEDNVKNYPYLLLNPIMGADGSMTATGPIAYTKPPEVPPALAALMAIADQDMRELLGDQAQGEKIVSNIASETVEMVQESLDLNTFIYMSNMAKAVRRAGEIWLGMASELFVEEGRVMKTLDEDGETSEVTLLKPGIDSKTGQDVLKNDLSEAKFDIVADVGPSSVSRRRSTVRQLREMMAVVPDQEVQSILSSLIMLNMEGEGIGDVRAYFRKRMLKAGVIEPTEEEAKELAAEAQNAAPSAQDKYLTAAADQAQADAVKARADTVLQLAKVDEIRAKIVELLAGVDMERQKVALDAAQTATDVSAALQQQSATVPEVQQAGTMQQGEQGMASGQP